MKFSYKWMVKCTLNYQKTYPLQALFLELHYLYTWHVQKNSNPRNINSFAQNLASKTKKMQFFQRVKYKFAHTLLNLEVQGHRLFSTTYWKFFRQVCSILKINYSVVNITKIVFPLVLEELRDYRFSKSYILVT